MTENEAITSLINSSNELLDIISTLKEENAFLTDTIVKNNLGELVNDRKRLNAEMQIIKHQADKDIESANCIKGEYFQRLSEVIAKQRDIDVFINSEVQKKVDDVKDEHRRQLNDAQLNYQKKLDIANNKNRILLLIAIVSLLIGIAGIVINFI